MPRAGAQKKAESRGSVLVWNSNVERAVYGNIWNRMVSYLRFRSALCSVLCIATKYGWLELSTLSPISRVFVLDRPQVTLLLGWGEGKCKGSCRWYIVDRVAQSGENRVISASKKKKGDAQVLPFYSKATAKTIGSPFSIYIIVNHDILIRLHFFNTLFNSPLPSHLLGCYFETNFFAWRYRRLPLNHEGKLSIPPTPTWIADTAKPWLHFDAQGKEFVKPFG